MDELNPSDMSTRRGLLRAFARSAARNAQDGAEALGPGGLQALLGVEEPPPDRREGPALPAARARVPARRCPRAISIDELLALAHEEGLTDRDDELRGLAKRSLRMTPTDGDKAEAWILTGDDWADAGDEVLLAVIHLAATARHDSELPRKGWLALFVEPADDGSPDSKPRRARGVLLDLPAAVSSAAVPVALSPELVIPRRWHEAVEALDLDDDQGDAYLRLRAQLQVLQATESDDDGGVLIAYHRLLGYPNETTGSMPADCVRAQQAPSAADETAPEADEQALPSRAWRLLAQISIGERRRAYVWIHHADLEAAEFGRLRAFVR